MPGVTVLGEQSWHGGKLCIMSLRGSRGDQDLPAHLRGRDRHVGGLGVEVARETAQLCCLNGYYGFCSALGSGQSTSLLSSLRESPGFLLVQGKNIINFIPTSMSKAMCCTPQNFPFIFSDYSSSFI